MAAPSYLFIPAQPTPNGPLHLGHIAGPYLKFDIMARFQRQAGHIAALVSGLDSYDSYVLRSARINGVSAAAAAQDYGAQIRRNLHELDIELDALVNPCDAQFAEEYAHHCQHSLRGLRERGLAVLHGESMPYSNLDDSSLAGYTVAGNCASCDSALAGYFCEACGALLRPEQVAQTQLPHSHQWRQRKNYFLDHAQIPVAAIEAHLARSRLPALMLALVRNRLLAPGTVRLTTNCPWGLPVADAPAADTVFFNYHAHGDYWLYGALAQAKWGLDSNPFAAGSSTVTAYSFGFDNSMAVLGELAMALLKPEMKAIDYYLPNYFMTLDGRKFSTSRKLAIFVDDMLAFGINTDLMRLFLALRDITQAEQDFTSSDFAAFSQDLLRFADCLQAACARLSRSAMTIAPAQAATRNQFEALLQEQRRQLSPGAHDVAAAAARAVAWLMRGFDAQAHDASDCYHWLHATAQLLYPFMPRMASHLSLALGLSALPRHADWGQACSLQHAPVFDPALLCNQAHGLQRLQAHCANLSHL